MAKASKKAASAAATIDATEDDLKQLMETTRKTYEALRAVDEDDLPSDRIQEYWRNRYFARTAWEHAENAAFASLVAQQK